MTCCVARQVPVARGRHWRCLILALDDVAHIVQAIPGFRTAPPRIMHRLYLVDDAAVELRNAAAARHSTAGLATLASIYACFQDDDLAIEVPSTEPSGSQYERFASCRL